MAKAYTVVFHREAYPSDAKLNTEPRSSSKIIKPLTTAYVAEVECGTETVAEAQLTVLAAYPSVYTDTPRVVVATELKES